MLTRVEAYEAINKKLNYIGQEFGEDDEDFENFLAEYIEGGDILRNVFENERTSFISGIVLGLVIGEDQERNENE